MSAIFAAILNCFSLAAIDFAGGGFIILSHAFTSPSQFPDLIYLYVLEAFCIRVEYLTQSQYLIRLFPILRD